MSQRSKAYESQRTKNQNMPSIIKNLNEVSENTSSVDSHSESELAFDPHNATTGLLKNEGEPVDSTVQMTKPTSYPKNN